MDSGGIAKSEKETHRQEGKLYDYTFGWDDKKCIALNWSGKFTKGPRVSCQANPSF